MATIFSHALIPLCIGLGLGKNIIPPRLLKLGIVLSILPDFDVLAFRFGIPYASQFGHRGFSHSIVMAMLVAALCCLFARSLGATKRSVFGFAFVAMISHALLDAMTDGGLGVALFWPWDLERYFLPWRTISVSPIGASFFSERGWLVLQSEVFTIALPALVLGLLLYCTRVLWQWQQAKLKR